MMRFCSEHGDCTPRHGPRYLSFLDETASKFRRRTRAHFGGEIEVITEGFKLLSSIFCGLLGFSEVDNCFLQVLFPCCCRVVLQHPPQGILRVLSHQ